ncbi:MAG: glycine cleavage system protein GcvH [Deinococcaceae bacterium]
MNIPKELQYLSSHEWVRIDGNIATVGITDYAQGQLGDVVYVELPAVGRELVAGDPVAVVESVKTASDIYSPVTGTVVEINDELTENTEWMNESAFDRGWMFKVEIDELSNELLSADDYLGSLED